MKQKLIRSHETKQIIGAFYEVYNVLGAGFLESVYKEALTVEFLNRNIPFEIEKQISIHFKGEVLKGKYYADIVCYGDIIIELKAVSEINSFHKAQLINYLKATNLKLGFLVNFGGSSLEFKRFLV